MPLQNIIGNIIGAGAGVKSTETIVNDFEARVEGDGGNFEAEQCLIDRIETLRNLGFYDKASLILTPNGYKQSKLYSLKPTSGLGDFVFARAGTATRKGPSLVEPVPYNLFSQSQAFDNAAWTKTNVTPTANATTAPNGTVTADQLLETTANAAHQVSQSITKSNVAIQYTVTWHLKGIGRDWVFMVLSDNTNGKRVWFDITNGVVGSTADVGTGGSFVINTTTISSSGQGFYKIRVTVTSNTQTAFTAGIGSATGDGVATFVGDVTKGFYAWQAQLVQGSTVLDDQTTTDRNAFPRFDYTLDTCPSLLLEPQRTNLALRSEEFDNASWVKTRMTVTANTTAAPDGLTTADSFFEDTSNNTHVIQQLFTKAASSLTYTGTIWVKPNQRDWVELLIGDNAGNSVGRYFNVTTGALGGAVSNGTGFTLTNSRISTLIDGYYRIEITCTSNTSTTLTIALLGATADGTNSYTGDVTKGYRLWGAQLEQASYATSYIPTTTATVTRVADAVTALTGVSSLIGQTEGTIYFEANSFADSSDKFVSISDGTLNNRVGIGFSSANKNQGVVVQSGVVQANISTTPSFVTGTNYKMAIVYNNNYAALFVNGTKIAEDTSVTVPACSSIRFSTGVTSDVPYGYTKLFAIAPVAISDAEAIALTT